LSYNRERALPAPGTSSARPFTAWPAGPQRFWDTPGVWVCRPGGLRCRQAWRPALQAVAQAVKPAGVW